jgi:hypothetical protein
VLGCDNGCSRKAPFTPYKIGDAEPTTAVPLTSARVVPSANIGTMQSVLTLQGSSLAAPEGTVFLQSLVADVDADGLDDAVAVTASLDGKRGVGLVFARGSSTSAPVLQSIAQYNLAAANCRARAELSTAEASPGAARHVLVDVGVTCINDAARAAGRVQWVDFAPPKPRVLLDLATRFAAANRPHLAALRPDLDGDGTPDLALQIERAGQQARAGWYLKASGTAPAQSEIAASLERSGAALRTRAAASAEAKSVAEDVHVVRDFLLEFCSGSPTPLGTQGATCLPALAAVDEAQVLALIKLNALPAAFAAHERALFEVGQLTGAAAYPRAKLEVALRAATTSRPVIEVNPYPTESTVERRSVAAGLLTFETESALLVREKDRVVRIDLDAGTQKPSDIAAYPLDVVIGNRGTWLDLFASCDASNLRAHVVNETTGDSVEVELPVSAPMSACSRQGRALPPRGDHGVAVHDASASEVVAEVFGTVVRLAPDATRATVSTAPLMATSGLRFGSAATQSGLRSVRPTPLGLLVTEAATAGGSVDATKPAAVVRPVLWTSTKLPNIAELGPCTVAPKGTRIACMQGAIVLVFR